MDEIIKTEDAAQTQPQGAETAQGDPAGDTGTAAAGSGGADTASPQDAAASKPAQQQAKKPETPPEPAAAKEAAQKQGAQGAPTQEAKEDPAEALARMTADLVEANLRAAALGAGVEEKNLDYALRLCDMTAAQEPGADIKALAKDQMAKVVADFPLLKGTAPDTGSLGNVRREQPKSAHDKARDDFAKRL